MAHQDHQFDSQENTEQKYNLNAQVTSDKGSVKYVNLNKCTFLTFVHSPKGFGFIPMIE